MSIGSIFSRLPGVLRFLRGNALSQLARRTVGFRLRRPFTALLREQFSQLSFMEAQTITRLAFEARLAASRAAGIRVRRPLEARDIPLLSSVTEDPVFGDRYQTSLAYQWFDAETGQNDWVFANIGTAEVPTLEVLQAEIAKQIRKGTAAFIYEGRFERLDKITFEVGTI